MGFLPIFLSFSTLTSSKASKISLCLSLRALLFSFDLSLEIIIIAGTIGQNRMIGNLSIIIDEFLKVFLAFSEVNITMGLVKAILKAVMKMGTMIEIIRRMVI